MKKPFKLRSQGQPFKMIGASPLKINPLAVWNAGKAVYKSKKARRLAAAGYGTIAGLDALGKPKDLPWYEKAAELAFDWAGPGDVFDALDWATGNNKGSHYPWKSSQGGSRSREIGGDNNEIEEISKNLRSGPKRSGTVKIGGKDVPYSSK
jgi:hypothetical protein